MASNAGFNSFNRVLIELEGHLIEMFKWRVHSFLRVEFVWDGHEDDSRRYCNGFERRRLPSICYFRQERKTAVHDRRKKPPKIRLYVQCTNCRRFGSFQCIEDKLIINPALGILQKSRTELICRNPRSASRRMYHVCRYSSMCRFHNTAWSRDASASDYWLQPSPI